MNFRHFKIKTKIILGFLIIILMLIGTGFVGVIGARNMAKSSDEFLSTHFLEVRAILELKNSLNRVALLLALFQQASDQTDLAARENIKTALFAEFEKVRYWENEFPDKADLAEVSVLEEEVLTMSAALSNLGGHDVSMTDLRKKMLDLEEKRRALDGVIQVLIDDEITHIEGMREQSARSILIMEKLVLLISLLATLLGLLAAFFITRSIYAPLKDLNAAMERYALGKFTERIPVVRNDEIGDLMKNLNLMSERLQESYSHLNEKTKLLEDQNNAMFEQNENLARTKTAMLSLLEDAKLLGDNLRKERDRIQAIVTSMIEGLIVVDEHYAIAMLNPAAERFFGVNANDVLGLDVRTAVPLYYGDELLSPSDYPLVKSLKNRSTLAIDLEDNINFKKGPNTKEIPVAMAISPLMSGDDTVGGICIFRDLTILKQLDEAKVNFISIASHQLRTPLTSMRWFSEMLLDGEAGALNEEQKHFVERVYQGTDRMIDLVNLLLQIARVEAGRLRVEPKPLDLVSMTRGVLSTIKVGLDAKKQTVNIVTYPEVLPQIPMDQEVIWQVIQNLLTNANRYSFEGGTITVTITQKDRVIEYAVKDNGIGIPPDQAPKLFEKFFRADNALQMVPEGSGLGLSLVKSLVEGWGGKIWFESEVGMGTTFFFTIGIDGMKEKTGAVSLVV